MAQHSHAHGDHDHDHDHGGHSSGKVLIWALVFTTGFAAVEAIGGWLSGSLALMGDAGHMITDSTALGLGALAAWISRQPPTRKHSFGLQRAEVIGAIFNAVFMVAVVVGITYEAVKRLEHPQAVHGGTVMVVAFVGLIVNIVVAWVLHSGEQNLNTRGALLHVLGDLLGSVAALAAGAVIYFTGWTPIDPILSVVIGVLILVSSLRLLQEAIHIVMEGVPGHINLAEVGRALAETPGVAEVHDLHIWTLSSGVYSLSAHVRVRDMQQWPELLATMELKLRDSWGISHSTLQPEAEYAVYAVPVPEPPRAGLRHD